MEAVLGNLSVLAITLGLFYATVSIRRPSTRP